jgi:hypothetical protein
MSLFLVVTLPATHLPDHLLVAADVFNHICGDSGSRYERGTDRDLAIVVDEEDPIETDGLACLGWDPLDLERVPGRDPVLFSSGF